MKPRLIELLGCPLCGAELRLAPDGQHREGEELMAGHLDCAGCNHRFPVAGGIPRLLPPELSAEKQRTARAFGWEWRHFVEMHDAYEEQFLDWLLPIDRGFFEGKVVLDAGCGIGRHTYFAAEYGAREVVAIDLSAAVETAFRNVGHLPNTHVVQADIYHPPFRLSPGGGPFDFIFSIGVLHHLPDPRGGFLSLVRHLHAGGTMFAWVYGREGNAFVHLLVTPMRRGITSRLPPGLVAKMAWLPAVVLQGVVRGVYRPLHGTPIFRVLPMRDYLYQLSHFPFRQNYSIVFDHLVPPTAHYLRRDEFESWFGDAGLCDVELTWRNRNSWRGRGRRAPAGGPEAEVSSRRSTGLSAP